MTGPMEQNVPLTRQTLRRLTRTIRVFATSEVGGRAMAAAGLLVVFLLGINGLNVLNSYVGRDFMTAIEQRDMNGFVAMALLYAGVFVGSTIVAVLYRFTEERLGVLWRDWLTKRLVSLYMGERIYYRIEVADQLANADQRIADDVRSFTTTTLSLFLIVTNGTFTLVAFSGVLWSISRPLFAVALGYAALGSLIAIVLGRPLVRLNYDQSDREAALRASLVNVRENAEAIAIERGGQRLEVGLRRQIDAIVANTKRIIAVNRNLNFFTTGYNYMIQLIPALIVAPMFIRGESEFGVIPQAAMAFSQAMGAFSVIVNQFPALSSYAAILARLSALVDAMEMAAGQAPRGIVMVDDDDRLALDRVTLHAPHDGRVLVRDLSVALDPGSRLLVRGPRDATGALMRALAGISTTGEGRIARPAGDGLVVLTDRPYLPAGTLRALIVERCGAPVLGDERVLAAVHAAGIDSTLERAGGLDVEVNRDFLLPEEQRLVDVARVLLAPPRFAVLMELETGIGAARAGEVLAALAARGIGYVALGDETLGSEHFDAVVDIAADGSWTRTVTRKGAA